MFGERRAVMSCRRRCPGRGGVTPGPDPGLPGPARDRDRCSGPRARAADAKALATWQAARDRVERGREPGPGHDAGLPGPDALPTRAAAPGGFRAAGAQPSVGRPPGPARPGRAGQGRTTPMPSETPRLARNSNRPPRRSRPRDRATAQRHRPRLTDHEDPQGRIQGYNAQLAVTDDHLILATALTQDTVDTDQAVPMITAAANAAAILERHRPPTGDTEPAPAPAGDEPGHHGINCPVRRRLPLRGQPHRRWPRPADRAGQTPRPPGPRPPTPPADHHRPTPPRSTRCDTGSKPPKATRPTNAAAPPSKPSSATSKT